MAFAHCCSASLALTLAFLLALFPQAKAQSVYETKYCSDLNTGSGSRNFSVYQSNSICANYCNGIQVPGQSQPFAFAVLQGNYCWCSDYVPATTTTGCSKPCPGFPDDLCGGDDLFTYLEIGGNEPAGTKGAPAATPIPTSTSPPSTRATTTLLSTTTPPSSRVTSSSSAWTPTAVTSLSEYAPGKTMTLIQTAAAPSSPGTGPKSGKSGLSTGGAVGLAVGLCALVALLVALAFFLLRKRRQEREAASADDLSRKGSSAGLGAGTIPSRTMSENSRYVLGTDGRRVIEQWEPGEAEEIRRSRLIPVDQRLDPFSAVYQRGDNKSRESVNTLRDDHDYSRRVASGPGILRATNPD
ncbi:putative Cell wall integrity and stress response component 4 [Drepanopeziza brunnea f. sp. 'multigermtubi' MB_m1]|uniref:Putative Cell wall integrity and stress response component 4 n=1 Tax=Marssonina brunnea f. sp. multigermtubi (strain MB_m1) TaxID=1072389 RepID=K1WGR8_MARBU|nr:putative Cell wall integrity and stress response component 4 [Drepanopeziza brunnea f. sp. 'multigermtubi' MB_m1]EKD16760.1 putative Cell wall integrity and stress response component 4 [Drepanopeziza brunnea f. sp. 'multigermtubi' MB_m1]